MWVPSNRPLCGQRCLQRYGCLHLDLPRPRKSGTHTGSCCCIDFGICIFCGKCVEYCPTNCLSMMEEYELSTYDRHELNYNQIALDRLPISITDDYTIRRILNSPQIKEKSDNK